MSKPDTNSSRIDRYHPYAIGLSHDNKWKSFFHLDPGCGETLKILIWLQEPSQELRDSLQTCLWDNGQDGLVFNFYPHLMPKISAKLRELLPQYPEPFQRKACWEDLFSFGD